MRTACDALTNPKPGDVVKIPGCIRTVLSNDGDCVRYMVTYNGERADIAPWCREQADALRAGKEVGDA
jgi:hypothetical protein